ncbi:MAG: hypothetical protein WBO30_15005 [Ferruginibacter sp.]
MYKLEKNVFKAQTFIEAERQNIFPLSVSLAERLNQGWYLSAMAFGLDAYNPPRMIKKFVSSGKHDT